MNVQSALKICWWYCHRICPFVKVNSATYYCDARGGWEYELVHRMAVATAAGMESSTGWCCSVYIHIDWGAAGVGRTYLNWKVEWRDYYNTYMSVSVYWECVRRHIKYWNYRVKYTRTHNIRRTIPFFDIKQVDSNYIFIKWKWMAHDVHVHVCTERAREKGMHVILIYCLAVFW